MRYLEVNPCYRETLERLQCDSVERLLELPAVAVAGHADRNVSRLSLETETGPLRLFLKCEHRVRMRDRLANLLAGLGPISRSAREARILQQIWSVGIGCPSWIAYGEDSSGRAFLLLRELSGFQDLRRFLHDHREMPFDLRQALARDLGRELARIHEAGFDHPDLCAKHILLNPDSGEICFLDWQRSRRQDFVPWQTRCRDLAALDATLADDWVSPRERLACLVSYFRARSRTAKMPRLRFPSLRTIIGEVQELSVRLQLKRRIQEQRMPPPPEGSQEIVRLEGEALCITWNFWREMGGRVPEILECVRRSGIVLERCRRRIVEMPGGRRVLLVQRRSWRPLRRIWSILSGYREESAELRQACWLNRHGPASAAWPRLLAYGQRRLAAGRLDSFLLTELPEESPS